MLSDSQMLRLDMENQVLARELSQFMLYYSRYSDPYVIGWVTTTVDFNSYQLKLDLGRNYPDEQPKLYVTYPIILRGYLGKKTINRLGTSHGFHTWKNGPSGCVQICHGYRWDASRTCVSVLLKGIFWLEMYDAYLRDGKTIAAHCR